DARDLELLIAAYQKHDNIDSHLLLRAQILLAIARQDAEAVRELGGLDSPALLYGPAELSSWGLLHGRLLLGDTDRAQMMIDLLDYCDEDGGLDPRDALLVALARQDSRACLLRGDAVAASQGAAALWSIPGAAEWLNTAEGAPLAQRYPQPKP
ncbi:MAG: hypothetical protein PF961_12125, partial [Planctomycetota bacterium]|nr:hypothetical protein [Planctomycetota bacterium]